MEDLDDVRTEILSTATEDLNGVWEAWWTVNRLRPELPLSSRLALAEEALRSLLTQDLVRLSRGSWDAQIDVPSADANDLLRDYATWVASADRRRLYCIVLRCKHTQYNTLVFDAVSLSFFEVIIPVPVTNSIIHGATPGCR